eukprot:11494499-Alexandrium_andersonii.AAC.1
MDSGHRRPVRLVGPLDERPSRASGPGPGRTPSCFVAHSQAIWNRALLFSHFCCASNSASRSLGGG